MAQNARTIPSPIHASTLFYAQFTTPSSASTFYFFATFPRNINPLRFNAAAASALITLISSHFYFLVRHQFITSFNQSISFVIPVLIAFLHLKYQGINGQNSTPFATHPKTMLVAISSFVFYCSAYFFLLRISSRRFAVVAYHCFVLSGYASVASLASLLFPDSVSPFVYAVFALVSAAELLHHLYLALVVVNEEEGGDFQAYGGRVRRFFNIVCRVVANSSRQRQQLLPV